MKTLTKVELVNLQYDVNHKIEFNLFSKKRYFSKTLKFETKKSENLSIFGFLVPRAGIEPARLAALVFETNASTNSAIWAFLNWCANITQKLNSEKII